MILMKLPDFNSMFVGIEADIHAAINREHKKRVKIMFADLVKTTPQWSGNYASNWWITTDPNISHYNPSPWKGATQRGTEGKRGDERGTARPIKLMNLAKFDYRQPVYFLNNTPVIFEEDTDKPSVVGYTQPYAGADFPSMTKVRPVNLVDSRVALQSYLVSKYK